jgi:hypothetical protein
LGVFLLQIQPDFPKEAFSRWVPWLGLAPLSSMKKQF